MINENPFSAMPQGRLQFLSSGGWNCCYIARKKKTNQKKQKAGKGFQGILPRLLLVACLQTEPPPSKDYTHKLFAYDRHPSRCFRSKLEQKKLAAWRLAPRAAASAPEHRKTCGGSCRADTTEGLGGKTQRSTEPRNRTSCLLTDGLSRSRWHVRPSVVKGLLHSCLQATIRF